MHSGKTSMAQELLGGLFSKISKKHFTFTKISFIIKNILSSNLNLFFYFNQMNSFKRGGRLYELTKRLYFGAPFNLYAVK